jgi:carbonic anhydrase/acetyltransferase-like protein (isoleucine patch superfamily)
MIYELGGKTPRLIGDWHYVADSSVVIGDVLLGSETSVWFNAVIRADNDQIIVGNRSNIQDGAVLHVDKGSPLNIGDGVTVGHKAVLHGCNIGQNTLVGINAVVLNGAIIGRNCLIGANTLVPEKMEIPDGSLVIGSPARVKRQLSENEIESLRKSAAHYCENAKVYATSLAMVQW